MVVRTSEAEWHGRVQDSGGSVRLGSGAFEGPYSFGSRFEDKAGTNPEELLGAAHASCFTMALSLLLTKAGYAPEGQVPSRDWSFRAEPASVSSSPRQRGVPTSWRRGGCRDQLTASGRIAPASRGSSDWAARPFNPGIFDAG